MYFPVGLKEALIAVEVYPLFRVSIGVCKSDLNFPVVGRLPDALVQNHNKKNKEEDGRVDKEAGQEQEVCLPLKLVNFIPIDQETLD